MKKISQNLVYPITIKNVSLICKNGEVILIDKDTKDIIDTFLPTDEIYYSYVYDIVYRIATKEIETKEYSNLVSRTFLMLYDANSKEKVVDDFIIINEKGSIYDGYILQSPHDDKYRFLNVRLYDRNSSFMSEPYDDITIDETCNSLRYARKGQTIFVYSNDKTKPYFEYDCDQLLSVFQHYERLFYVIKNGKKGLIYLKDKSVGYDVKLLLNIDYDEIIYDYVVHNGNAIPIYYVKKDGFVGLFKQQSLFNKLNEVFSIKYDDIKKLFEGYFQLIHDGYVDIVNIFNPHHFVVKNIKIQEIVYASKKKIIYEQNGKYGMLIFKDKKDKIFVLDTKPIYDDIKRLNVSYDFFIVSKNGKKGLMFKEDQIVESRYQDMEVKLHFSLAYILGKNDDGTVTLGMINQNDKMSITWLGTYDKVNIFSRAIAVTTNDECKKTCLLDSNGFELYHVDGEHSVKQLGDIYDECCCFMIDDDIYHYYVEDSKFVLASLEKHNSFCESLESIKEEGTENISGVTYQKSLKIKNKFFNLRK